MPSDPDVSDPSDITGRCYCGAVRLRLTAAPSSIAYCHCLDCRRWTGAPVAAFAAIAPGDLIAQPVLGPGHSATTGVHRWNCATCGSPLAARFDYLPDRLWVPLGILDNAAQLPPTSHSHADAALPWLHLHDDLPQSAGSGRDRLNADLS